MQQMMQIKNPFSSNIPADWTRKHWALVKDNKDDDFPILIADCVKHIEEHGVNVEGIMRISGSQTRIQELKRGYDRGKATRDFTGEPIHNVAGLLKSYFKDSSEPLLGSSKYDQWFQCSTLLKSPEKAVPRLKELIAELEPIQEKVFHRMVLFLEKLSESEATNKMGKQNLAVMFAPLFLRSARQQNAHEILEDNKVLVDILLFVLLHHKELFKDSSSAKKKPEEPEEVVRLRKAYNDALRWSGFVLAEDPLFIPISWSDEPDKGLDAAHDVLAGMLFGPDDEASVVFEDKHKKNLQRISPCKLVTFVTQNLEPAQRELRSNFIQIYKLFFTRRELFLLLSLRYVGPSEKGDRTIYKDFKKVRETVHMAVAELLREWIETLPQDFLDDGLYRRLEKFFYAEINSQYTSYKPAGHINESFDQLNKFMKAHNRHSTPVTPPTLHPNPVLPSLSTGDVAEQLTMREYEQLTHITPDELLNTAWMHDDRGKRCPTMSAYIAYFYRMMRVFITEMVKATDIEQRVSVMEAMIKIATRCKELHNYATVMQILLSLYSSPVARLKSTWAAMPPKLLFQLEALTKLMSPTGEFAEYHKEVKGLKPPYVPYMGAELPVFATIDQNNPSVIEQKDALLNYEKARRMLDALKKFYAFKAKAYSLNNTSKDVAQFLSSAESWELNELTQIAILREAAVEPKDKKAKKATPPEKEDWKYNFMLTEAELKLLFVKTKEIKIAKGKVLTDDEIPRGHFALVKNHGRVVCELKPPQAFRTAPRGEDESSSTSATKESSSKLTSNDSDDEDSGSSEDEEREARKKAQVEGTSVVRNLGFLFGKKDKKGHRYFADKGDFVGELSLISRWSKVQPERFSITDVTECQLLVMEDINVYQAIASNPSLGRRLYRRVCLRLAGYIYSHPLPSPPRDERYHRSKSKDKEKEKDRSDKSEDDKKKNAVKKGDSYDIKAPKEFRCRLRDVVTAQGVLTIAPNGVTFYGRIFGCESKASLPMHPSVIKEAVAEDGDLILTTPDRQYTFEFASVMSADAAVSVLNLHLKDTKDDAPVPSGLTESSRHAASGAAGLLTLQDWELLVKGVNVIQYEKGEHIIREGHFYDKIMQLGSGTVNIMKARRHIDRDKPPYKIGELRSPALFGDTLFALWKPARASVIAAESCEVYVIEGYYVRALLDIKTGLPPRFFHWLAENLAERAEAKSVFKAGY